MPASNEELFDVVDEYDNAIDTLPRSEVHRLGLRHRAVHIFLFRTDGRMLIHLRTADKEEFPSVWTSSASGHVSAGEGYAESAQRELQEELGISAQLRRIKKFAACPDTSNEFTELFTAESDAALKIDPAEIADTRWLTIFELQQKLEATPDDFSPAFLLLFSHFTKSSHAMKPQS